VTTSSILQDFQCCLKTQLLYCSVWHVQCLCSDTRQVGHLTVFFCFLNCFLSRKTSTFDTHLTHTSAPVYGQSKTAINLQNSIMFDSETGYVAISEQWRSEMMIQRYNVKNLLDNRKLG